MNYKDLLYSVKQFRDEVYENIDMAIEQIDFGDFDKEIDILQAVKKEIGEEWWKN